jgi:hypothetical protein
MFQLSRRRTMSSDATWNLLERFWRGHEAGDPDALAAELHNEVVVSWPQSGEHIHGKGNMDAINRALPGGHPTGELIEMRAIGDVGILEMKLDYGGETVYVVEILELKDDKVHRATEYFADPFDAPDWRAQWVEKV